MSGTNEIMSRQLCGAWLDEDDACAAYMAERAFVEGTLSDDDREFDVGYLLYAYGCDTIAKLYNPHEFDSETRTRFLWWIQRQVAPVKEEFREAFWDDAFLIHHNIRAMYTAWEVASLVKETNIY
jgi:hypothetical protein